MRIIAIKHNRTVRVIESATEAEWLKVGHSFTWVDKYGKEHTMEGVFNVIKQTRKTKLLRVYHPLLGTNDYLSPSAMTDVKDLDCNNKTILLKSIWATLPSIETIRLAANGKAIQSQWEFNWATLPN